MSNLFLLSIILICVNFMIKLLVNLLNISHLQKEMPHEFVGVWDQNKYKLSQRYTKENALLDATSAFVFNAALLAVLAYGGLPALDAYVRSFGFGEIGTGVFFFVLVALVLDVLALPLSAYRTFVLEEKYGFNRTSGPTFIKDFLISTALMLVIWSLLVATLLANFLFFKEKAWLLSWALFAAYTLLITYIAPIWIFPLFNRFTPLPSGNLHETIQRYLNSQNFKLEQVYSIDGSKRSSKANAYFTGFGKTKHVALFDTLISGFSTQEIVAILAHEVGHYKKRHIGKALFFSLLFYGLLFFLFSQTLQYPPLFQAFDVRPSIYMGGMLFLIFFGTLSWVFQLFFHALSRKHEFEADHFAAVTAGAAPMITALKKLSADHLSNLTPHPLKVIFSYSHPPILDRLRHLYTALD